MSNLSPTALTNYRRWIGFLLVLLAAFTAACADESPESVPPTEAVPALPPETAVPTATPLPAATDTPTLPTATPTPPLAAQVNGQPITLADYEQELARYVQGQQVLDAPPAAGYESRVLTGLIEQEVIRQAAVQNGISVSDEEVQAKLNEMVAQANGQENFDAWLAANQVTADEFPALLRTEMLTEQMVQFVTSRVPREVEQVRARYIETADRATAEQLSAELEAGADFATLAEIHSLDRATAEDGGDLDFFARGFLLIPELEEAAFALEVGEVSDVIVVSKADGTTGYYLITTIERDPARALEAGQRSLLLQREFENWLAAQLSQAQIVRYVE